VLFSDLTIDNNVFETFTVAAVGIDKDKSKSTDEATLKKLKKDNKTAKGHLLNHMTNPLFYLFVTFKYAKNIWEKLEVKYRANDAKKKNFVVGECL